jgi:LacI family transcriptional regulator
MKMEDVAKQLGLSRITLSRVINGHDNVSPRTRKRVLDYMKETGYQPHYAARILTQKKSNTIGILVTHGYNILVSHIVATVLDEIARHSLEADMLLASDAATEKQAIVSLTRRTVDGLIVFSNFSDGKFLERVAREHKNIVFNGPGPKGALAIRTDHIKGMKQIMTYLYESGHKRIHYIGAPRVMARAGSDERQLGYLESIRAARLKPSTSFATDVDPAAGYREAKNVLLSRSPHPTAIVCFNDELAFGALRAAGELGVSVPEELSITGYDGNELFRYSKPSLTTYRLDPSVLGKLLVQTLMKQLGTDQNLHGETWHEGELIIGESAGRSPA